jgi:predicted RND superfamily exporter protein
MFRSLSIPLIVLIPIEIAIWINMAVPYFAGQNLNYIGYLVIDAVQLGASVDYAIIFTREYLEQRRTQPPLKAARAAISKSAVVIMTSALILTIAGLSIFFVASNTLISEIGMLIGRGAFISMLMMFTLLPLLFVLCDWIVRHTSLGLSAGAFKRGGAGGSGEGSAEGCAEGTMERRPAPSR